MANIKIIKKNLLSILEEVKRETPIIIFKKFFNRTDCKKIIRLCDNNFKINLNRKYHPNKYFNFTSVDVLPTNSKTKRIIRTFELSNHTVKKFKSIKKIQLLQKKIVKLKKNLKIYKKVQVIHYPTGGGFLAEHVHPRYPTNYGFIITLSKKNKDFKKGVTNFRLNQKLISLEKFDLTSGDLILFRFDLPHSISPCDPKEILKFDQKGRWTLVFPIYHKKF